MDTAACNGLLDNTFGASHGAAAPDDFELALFAGNPEDEGVEISDTTELEDETTEPNGYARVTVGNDATWAPAVAAVKTTTAPIAMPDVTSSEGYDETPDYWALIADGVLWASGRILDPTPITSAGDGLLVQPTIFAVQRTADIGE